jgi:BolA protein
MSVYKIITEKLQNALNPSEIRVIDESHLHAGHAGAREGGESHFAIYITSEKFSGLTRLQRHKLIYTLLDSQMKHAIHALRISAAAPEEK